MKTRWAPHGVTVIICFNLLRFRNNVIAMKECLKTFCPVFHVKCGGATYTRINTVSVLMCTFFFKQKNAGDQFIFRAKFNLSSHFSGKNLVPSQIILSSYAHEYYIHENKNYMNTIWTFLNVGLIQKEPVRL